MKKSKFNQVGNLEKLVSFVNAQGAVYNPSKASIKNAALQTLLTQAQGAVQAVDVSRNAYEIALNARQQAFGPIPKTARRIIASLKACGASAEVMEDCMAIKRKFRGQGAKSGKPPATVNAESPESAVAVSRKVSYLDLESVIANFQSLVTRATTDPLYKPNEADLQAATLTALVATLRDRNKAVKTTYTNLKEANLALNKLLYDASGIYGQATAVKAYIESLYGFRSPKHKAVVALTFKKG